MVLDLSAIRPKADIAERDAGSGVSLLKVTAPRFWPPQQEIKRISTTNQPRGKVFHASPRHSLARPLNRGTGNMWMRGELSSSAMRTGWEARGAELSRHLISDGLRNPDVLALLVLAVIGLLLVVSLALLFPLPDDIATALAQLS
jgi:hypothetical protein